MTSTNTTAAAVMKADNNNTNATAAASASAASGGTGGMVKLTKQKNGLHGMWSVKVVTFQIFLLTDPAHSPQQLVTVRTSPFHPLCCRSYRDVCSARPRTFGFTTVVASVSSF